MVYQEVDEEIQKMFDSVLSQTSIPQWVTVKILENSKLKQVAEIKKNSDLQIFISDINIVIIVNSVVFDQLEDDDKKLIFEELLSGLTINPDTDKIAIEKPNIQTYSMFLSKYGDQKIIRLKESILSIFEKIEEEEKQIKQQKAEKKTKKKSY